MLNQISSIEYCIMYFFCGGGDIKLTKFKIGRICSVSSSHRSQIEPPEIFIHAWNNIIDRTKLLPRNTRASDQTTRNTRASDQTTRIRNSEQNHPLK